MSGDIFIRRGTNVAVWSFALTRGAYNKVEVVTKNNNLMLFSIFLITVPFVLEIA